ncbi:hypothetical protein SSTU70S_00870 [Stutzerimonas stutzeri]
MNNKNKVIGYAGVPSRQGRLVLALSGLAVSSSALALPTVEFDNGLVLQSQITANYTLSVRDRRTSPLLPRASIRSTLTRTTSRCS